MLSERIRKRNRNKVSIRRMDLRDPCPLFTEIIIPYHVTLLYYSVLIKMIHQSYCAYVLHVPFVVISFFYRIIWTGGGLDEIQDFSCR